MADDAPLERAGLYRLFGELFVDAPDEPLLTLAATVPGLAQAEASGMTERYTRVFVLNAYPFGSVYLSPDGAVGGEHAGFTGGVLNALGLAVEDGLAPDHMSVLVGAVSALLEREAGARDGMRAERARHAQRSLLAEHLLPWAPHFLDAVARVDDGLYAAAAAAERRLLTGHAGSLFGDNGDDAAVALGDGGRGPAREHRSDADPHESAAPPAADDVSPLVALTRPARCGFFVCRADIGAIAAELGLPVRFGGRAFMLESLVQAAAQAGAGDRLGDALARFATERRRVLEAWSSALPGLAHLWEVALARLDATVTGLRGEAAERALGPVTGVPGAAP